MTRRTTIEVDDEVLAEVQAILGTSGLKDSVDEAFSRILRTARQRAFADAIIDGTLIDLDPSLRDEMWR